MSQIKILKFFMLFLIIFLIVIGLFTIIIPDKVEEKTPILPKSENKMPVKNKAPKKKIKYEDYRYTYKVRGDIITINNIETKGNIIADFLPNNDSFNDFEKININNKIILGIKYNLVEDHIINVELSYSELVNFKSSNSLSLTAVINEGSSKRNKKIIFNGRIVNETIVDDLLFEKIAKKSFEGGEGGKK